MPGIFWRVLIAVFVIVFVYALLPPVLSVIGISLSADVMKIIRICVGGIALFYIVFGRNPPWKPAP